MLIRPGDILLLEDLGLLGVCLNQVFKFEGICFEVIQFPGLLVECDQFPVPVANGPIAFMLPKVRGWFAAGIPLKQRKETLPVERIEFIAAVVFGVVDAGKIEKGGHEIVNVSRFLNS